MPTITQHIHNLSQGDGFKARLVRGGLGSAGVQAANRLLTLGLGIVLARMLGPDGYGVYAYAFAMMSLLMVVAEAGVPTLLMRELAASHGRGEWGLLRGALRRGAQFATLAATTVTLLGLFALWWFADSMQQEVLYTTALMLLALPIMALTKTVAHAMRGLHRVVVGKGLEMVIRPLFVLLIVAGVFMAWPEQRQPHIAMAAQLLGALTALLIGISILPYFLPSQNRAVPAEYRSRQWLKSALPFTLFGGAAIVNNQADIIMLGWFTDSGEVGVYRVAAQGATLVAFSLQAVNGVVAPQFSRLHAQGDIERLQQLVTSSARIILAGALPMAVAFMLAGGLIVELIFGSKYVNAHIPLAILAAGQLINAGFGSVGFLLNMTGHESITARLLWQTAALNIILNLLLIPFFELPGAAAASAFSLALWNILLYRQVRNQLGISSTFLRVRN